MKPVRLTIQAFGPYPGRTVVDFRAAVDAGLFGIYGPTGSGKSTLFSAMTFALFGEPAKSEQEATSLRSDHADAGITTEVEFAFDIGAKRYVVVRRPEQTRPKKSGGGETRSAHTAFLFDATGMALDDIGDENRGVILAEKKVGEVNQAISDLLGYGAAQFRQIVLLPQGRFEAFLSAKTKDRLDILRELFDVSRYGAIMGTLKADAEAAERAGREERAVCQGRLTAEGFESAEALGDGITRAQAQQALLQDAENAAQAAFDAGQSGLQGGLRIEALFQAAEGAQKLLGELQAGQAQMDVLASRNLKVERAATLRDVENRITESGAAVIAAVEKHGLAVKTATDTGAKARTAAEALKQEADRAGESEALRQRIDALARHREILEKAGVDTQALENARTREASAYQALEAGRARVTAAQGRQREKVLALKTAEAVEARRAELSVRLTTTKAALAQSEAFEKATASVQSAKAEAATVAARGQAAKKTAETAREAYDTAEQKLADAQAQHLASRLVDGESCPVCGATEHPAPATGTTEAAGRDKAFRDAKAAWQTADTQARAVEQDIARAEATLLERQGHLDGLAAPQDTGAVLKAQEAETRQAFNALGPKLDTKAAQVEIEQLDQQIATLETQRDTLQADLATCQADTLTRAARLDEMLAPVPQALRDRTALEAAHKATSQDLAARQAAKERAEAAATATREAEIAAHKDQDAARELMALAQDQQRKAAEDFSARLTQAELSQQDYGAIKPFIATLQQDRAAVAEYQRKLDNAREAAANTAADVSQLERPVLADMHTRCDEAQAALAIAREQRSAAGHQLLHLTGLRDSLADAMRKLEEAETASGALRSLAAAVNGDNAQKLDLETFAIGAMFDQVLDAANLRLGPMTGERYRMQRDKEGGGRGRRGLGIEVFDIHTGKARPTATLSGGESFIAALALALGLADIVESASGKVRLDTIFIDEGFGSLDAEDSAGTLDKVLDVLGTLVKQNRAVGLISHVRQVQDAIPNGFYIRKSASGSSSVETRSNA